MVASALGYRAVIVIPDTQAQEKKDMLRLAGAELVEVPAVPYSNPNNYVRYSGRSRRRWRRPNPRGHLGKPVRQCRQPAGPLRNDRSRDYDDLDGKVDGFVSAVGQGVHWPALGWP